jgi:hypothetical protein
MASYWLPESPIWLASVGRAADAEVVLTKAAKIHRIPPPVSFPKAALAVTPISENLRAYGRNMCMLFKPPQLKVTRPAR